MAFSGTFDYSLDAKNRLTVPAKMRASLSDSVVLSRGTERCVTIWPKAGFEAFAADTLQGLHPLSKERDALKRYFFSNSFETELDAAGRVMLPPKMLAYAGLTKEVVVNGVDDRIEVWDRETWATYNDALDIGDLAALIAGAAPGAPA